MKLPHWDVEIEGIRHTVELRHSFWLALLICVDGSLVHRARAFPPPPVGDFAFSIAGRDAVLRVRHLHTFIDYSLTVNGQTIENKPVR
jgi:hypothetical protein